MDEPEIPERFKGNPEVEKAWRDGHRDSAELGQNFAALVVSLYRLRWLLLTLAIVAIGLAIFR